MKKNHQHEKVTGNRSRSSNDARYLPDSSTGQCSRFRLQIRLCKSDWAEYWQNENVYLASGSTLKSSSEEADARGEYDKGAFDVVTRATKNHGLHRGSFQCDAVIHDTDGKAYEISYWTSEEVSAKDENGQDTTKKLSMQS